MELSDELRRRCQAAGLEFEEIEAGHAVHDPIPMYLIQFPKGRSTREVEIDGDDEALVRWFLREPFEAYAYLEGFEASWSAQHRVIECNLVDAASSSLLLTNMPWWTLNRVTDALGLQLSDASDTEKRLKFAAADGLDVSIGPSSNVHSMLSHSVDAADEAYEGEEAVQENILRTLTLRIEGTEATRHDYVTETLERVANAVLFQVDLHLELPLLLERGRGQTRSFSLQSPREKEATPFPAAKFEYDREAMSLYWYGRSASKMPLMRFLANYQVLEFYFPVYSEIEAHMTLRNVLKDPTFDPTRDAHVSRLLSAIKVGAKGRTYGNESEQIEATIRHCVTADDLRSFLISEDEARYRFYTSDEAKKLVGDTLPVRKKSDDHRGAVAKRIYAIRNRIVHTKGGFEEREPLLPFDPETKHLRHDIELVEFLARKVLVASSRPLRG